MPEHGPASGEAPTPWCAGHCLSCMGKAAELWSAQAWSGWLMIRFAHSPNRKPSGPPLID